MNVSGNMLNGERMKLDLKDKEAILAGTKPHRLDAWPDEAEGQHWDRNFQWTNRKGKLSLVEQINPFRVPEGYRLLDPFEYIEKGDIWWNQCDFIWCPTDDKPIGTPYFHGHPYARKE